MYVLNTPERRTPWLNNSGCATTQESRGLPASCSEAKKPEEIQTFGHSAPALDKSDNGKLEHPFFLKGC